MTVHRKFHVIKNNLIM